MSVSPTGQRIAVLGSTGSIGTSTLAVAENLAENAKIVGLTAHHRWESLVAQAQRWQPRFVVLSDEEQARSVGPGAFPPGVELWSGQAGLERLAAHQDVDTVIAGIVGAAGLRSTWTAIEAGKRVGLANKETMVVAGPLVMDLARKSGATIIPVDSEHSAIFQALQCGQRGDVKRIILTASGGPFRAWSKAQLEQATPRDALAHPTWNMGRKITIDSATLINKALEVIEARWLFGLSADQIEVVIHPQSIIHSFVEFQDGSVIAQLSPPDMKLPIQYALTYPARENGVSPRMDWKVAFGLDFAPPDRDRFPGLELGFEVARRGGTCGAVLNAANEVAVARFLEGDLTFCDIPRVCRAVLAQHDFDPNPGLSDLFRWDAWAREETRRWRS